MKKKLYLLLLFSWSFVEYIIYLVLSFGTCYFKFRVTDYSYFLHFTTNILLELLILYLFKKDKTVRIFVVIHFIIFIIYFYTNIGNYFESLPLPCSINTIRKIT